jgi:hypothetical protein
LNRAATASVPGFADPAPQSKSIRSASTPTAAQLAARLAAVVVGA